MPKVGVGRFYSKEKHGALERERRKKNGVMWRVLTIVYDCVVTYALSVSPVGSGIKSVTAIDAERADSLKSVPPELTVKGHRLTKPKITNNSSFLLIDSHYLSINEQ